METTTAAVTVKITSISERFDNTTFADAAGSGMAILLCRQSYFHAQFGAVHESGSGSEADISKQAFACPLLERSGHDVTASGVSTGR